MARLQLEDYLPTLEETSLAADGRPLSVRVDQVDEDPAQPRHEFDDSALLELAATIKERGVLQPISVRPHPHAPERWLLNFGARRLRAARLAGLEVIPALVDTAGDSYDQVIENEQREGLSPLELALFVQKRLAAGDRKAEIARRLGKSRQYLTLATALIEAPDWLLDAYRERRCRGMVELYELRRLHVEHPQRVEAWVAATPSITRERVAALRRELAMPGDAGEPGPEVGSSTCEPDLVTEDAAARGRRDGSAATAGARRPKLDKRIHVEFEGGDFELVVNVAPQRPGTLYIRPLAGGPRQVAPAAALTLRGFIDR